MSCSPDSIDCPRWILFYCAIPTLYLWYTVCLCTYLKYILLLLYTKHQCIVHFMSRLLRHTYTIFRNTNSSGLRFWAIVTIVLAALPRNEPTTLCSACTWDSPWSKLSSKNYDFGLKSEVPSGVGIDICLLFFSAIPDTYNRRQIRRWTCGWAYTRELF